MECAATRLFKIKEENKIIKHPIYLLLLILMGIGIITQILLGARFFQTKQFAYNFVKSFSKGLAVERFSSILSTINFTVWSLFVIILFIYFITYFIKEYYQFQYFLSHIWHSSIHFFQRIGGLLHFQAKKKQAKSILSKK